MAIYYTIKREEIEFMIGLELSQLCLSSMQIQMNLMDNVPFSDYVNLSIDTPKLIEIDGRKIIPTQGYDKLLKFIGRKIINVDTTDESIGFLFHNGQMNIIFESDGYESLSIWNPKEKRTVII